MKKVLTIISVIVVFSTLVCVGLYHVDRSSSGDESLESYESEGILRVYGEAASVLSEEDIQALHTLGEDIGTILYEVEDDYNPDQPETLLQGATASYLKNQARMHDVKSNVLDYTLLDIRTEQERNADLLVCYRLDYQNSEMLRDEYLFLLDLRVSHGDEGWICISATALGSAPAADYMLSRDDLTGNIRLIPTKMEEVY